ncbi:uncharacterized protein LOC128392217 [Panonychus citri]|uniref:uncharacterized protein LOC128392217 n=1 Tax=Panonychus citri TaxID=50023 RepID=UPI002307C250|nr:uncharacterized protein LOC128392217 [Panonychus citri]
MNTLTKISSFLGSSSRHLIYSSKAFSICSPASIPPPPLLPPAKVTFPIVEKPRFGVPIQRQQMPTRFSLINELFAPSVYDFRVTIAPEISDPRKLDEIKCISKKDKYGSIPDFNYSNTIMHIRHRKIKKHHRIKWIKNNLSAIKYTRLRRNIQKEKLFRAEIFAAVKEAEDFDAEKYVDGILNAIDKAPKPADKEEGLRKTIALMRKYRAETDLITPEFEDPVKPVHDNVFRIK